MSSIHVKSERVIDAKPEDVYEALADYKVKRQQMLTPNFLDYTVEKGGHGNGTMLRYRLLAARRERPYHMSVQEPVKGQVITERDLNSSLVTTWKVASVDGGQKTRVSVESEWMGGRGIKGFFESTFAPIGLHRIYGRMLSLLGLLVQPSEAREEHEDTSSRLGMFFMLFGVVVAVAFIIRSLQKKK